MFPSALADNIINHYGGLMASCAKVHHCREEALYNDLLHEVRGRQEEEVLQNGILHC